MFYIVLIHFILCLCSVCILVWMVVSVPSKFCAKFDFMYDWLMASVCSLYLMVNEHVLSTENNYINLQTNLQLLYNE